MTVLDTIPTAITEDEMAELQSLSINKTVLEVGSLLGASTIGIAQVAAVVHSVDPHEGYPAENPRSTLFQFIENLVEAGVREKIIIHIGRDGDVLPWFKAQSFEMVFIDLTGEYLDTVYAIEMGKQLLVDGGILCVHDCGNPDWPGTMQAVEKFAKETHRQYRLIDRLAVFDEQKWS